MKRLQRFTTLALVLSLVTSLALGATYMAAHAQAVDGTLSDLGEGDNRVLSSDWTTLNPGEQITYQFAYDGNEQPVSVWMNGAPADAANFQIWTNDRLEALKEDSNTQPLGQGTAMSAGSGFTNWQGGSPEAETYYVVVSATGNSTARFLLNISSPALAETQPGAIAVTPTAPTAPADPNIAVVTTDALNVRSGPSTAFPVLTTITTGTQMTVLGRNPANTWINVRLADNTEGWVTRSLTSYTLVSPNVIASSLQLGAAATVAASVTATNTATNTVANTTGNTITNTTTSALTPTLPITATAGVTLTELGENWQVLEPGDVDWYTFQYRGGNLPLTVWMDVEPYSDAQFTVLNTESAQAIMAGTTITPTNVVGRGIANPIEPGYLFWQANFTEADTYYVMVTPSAAADGNVLYTINALGPGVGRVVEPAQ
jgi:uncharacterized protein YraI